ncbi:MAG: type III pantothenate kinase, partial [Calditrichia bacterium]|nr:type III pantothenate kinase [Calditrichia bacterium]
MIVLGVDLGNTHGSIGIFKNGLLNATIRLSSAKEKTEDEFWFYIERFLHQQKIMVNEIEDVVVSSVVPGLNFAFQKLAQKYFNKDALFITSELDLGIKIDIPLPQQ